MEEIKILNKPAVNKESINILVIDDELGIRDLLSYELNLQGYRVRVATNGEEALGIINHERFQVVISDIKMPKLGGLETLDAIKRIDPEAEVILATGYGTIESAVTAMKKGAYDYIQKPFNISEILALIEKALEKRELKVLVAMFEASKAVFSSVRQEKLFPIVAGLVMKVLRADAVSIWPFDDEGKMAQAVSTVLDNTELGRSMARLVASAGNDAIDKREPVFFREAIAKDSAPPSSPKEISSIVFPLVLESTTVGVVIASRLSTNNSFNSGDGKNMAILCSYIAQAISNSNLYKHLEKKVDELKVANQRLEEAQKQLVQSEKLAAIGQLAAGVAHELNNPLTGILGFSQILLQGDDLTGTQREDLEGIHQESQRCRQIIQNLLQFSRRRDPQKEKVNLISLVESTLQLVQYRFSTSGIEITKDFPSSPAFILGDSSQLQQVFINILTNAQQAMEGRKDGRVGLKVSSVGGDIVVSFSDNGEGIASQNLGKIFDPFFTTKPVGKGTGLGLSISYGIIQNHGGSIHAESQKGNGTTITIGFPSYESINKAA